MQKWSRLHCKIKINTEKSQKFWANHFRKTEGNTRELHGEREENRNRNREWGDFSCTQ